MSHLLHHRRHHLHHHCYHHFVIDHRAGTISEEQTAHKHTGIDNRQEEEAWLHAIYQLK